jgi:hypothetical protein
MHRGGEADPFHSAMHLGCTSTHTDTYHGRNPKIHLKLLLNIRNVSWVGEIKVSESKSNICWAKYSHLRGLTQKGKGTTVGAGSCWPFCATWNAQGRPGYMYNLCAILKYQRTPLDPWPGVLKNYTPLTGVVKHQRTYPKPPVLCWSFHETCWCFENFQKAQNLRLFWFWKFWKTRNQRLSFILKIKKKREAKVVWFWIFLKTQNWRFFKFWKSL